MIAVTVFAPAKINLCLHVVGRRPDGYHLIESLVGFADVGDCVIARSALTLSLKVTGGEAAGLASEDDNLVLRAARVLAGHAGIAAAAELHLEKNLPVAAGIGGGSADAAAALRALRELWRLTINDSALATIGAQLGADVPVCVHGQAAWVAGIGEQVEPCRPLPEAGVLLVNPRRPLPTAAVFAARRGGFGTVGRRFAPWPDDAARLARLLLPLRNDLTATAIGLVPEIAEVLTALGRLRGALVARMSGSGATCFALFRDRSAAVRAQVKLAAAKPGWWCAAGSLIAGSGVSR